MKINVNYDSAAKRRFIIAVTIIPFTVIAALGAARETVGQMWRSAAAAWRG